MSRRGAIAAGLLLVAIGALFLVRELVPAFDFGRLLPVASVLLGLVFIVLSFRPARPDH
jgi:hypothetical protein